MFLVPGAGFDPPAQRRNFAGRQGGDRSTPTYQQVTYRRGEVNAARFAPDGATFVYSAAWEGRPQEVFTARFCKNLRAELRIGFCFFLCHTLTSVNVLIE